MSKSDILLMKLEELLVYQMSMELGEKVWKIVITWDFLAKDTVGKQLIRAADSIAANLSEGFGRYHFKESINFGYYSRGSLYETKTWVIKALNRNLISPEEKDYFVQSIDVIGLKLNKYINSIGKINDHNPPNDQ